MISIKNKSKATVLAALYNNSKPQGRGFLDFDPLPMSEKEAEELLEDREYFDYIKGRIIKTDFEGNELDPWGYDRDNGEGAMVRVINQIE